VFSEAISYARAGAHVRVVTPHFLGADKIEQIDKRVTVFRFQYFFPKSLQVLKRTGVPIYTQRSFLGLLQIPLLCLLFAIHILKHSHWSDIIHAQWTVTALLSLPAKWIHGKKIVLTARGSDLRLLPAWLNRYIHSAVDGAIDCFGPQPWNDAYKGNFPSNYVKLPLIVDDNASGVVPEDMKKSLYGKLDPFIVLYVGRFDYTKIKKNRLPLINLIHASRSLKAQGMDFHIFYIGDGETQIREKMRGLICENHLEDTVTLLGIKTNIPDYIQFCHLGAGGIALNAVSQEFTILGKPQILIDGADNVGTPWRHGVNSILVRPEHETDLVELLRWAMLNRKDVMKIGENARRDMSEYIADSGSGGKLYLTEFQNLLN
jgi:glycosyltransferase involved in cell wall biosynthesis